MFPGATASVYRNEAGEVLGWEYDYYDEYDEYDPDDYRPDDPDDDEDDEDEDDEDDEEEEPRLVSLRKVPPDPWRQPGDPVDEPF